MPTSDQALKPSAPQPQPAPTEPALPALAPQPAAAMGQSAELMALSGELDGGAPPPGGEDPAAAQAKEAQRVAAAQAEWQQILGNKLGEKAFALIQQHLSYSALSKHAHKATEGMAKAMTKGPVKATESGAMMGLMDEAEEAKAVNALLAALAPAVKAEADEWIKGPDAQAMAKSISEWAEEHPEVILALLGAAAIGAAVAAYVSDYDPKAFSKTFKLSDRFSVGGALDLASLQKIMNKGIDSATLFVEYEAKDITASLSATYAPGEAGSVTGKVGYAGEQMKATLEGTYKTDDTYSAKASGSYEAGGHTLSGFAEQTEKGTSAGASAKGEGTLGRFNSDYSGDVKVDPDGRATVKVAGGLKGVIGDAQAKAGISASHSAGGDQADKTRVAGDLTLGQDGEQTSLEGWLENGGESFGFDLKRTTLGGKAFSSQGISQGPDGMEHHRSVGYMDEGFQLKFDEKTSSEALSQSLSLGGGDDDFGYNLGLKATDGDVTGASAGTHFNLGDFKNQLNLEMDKGVTTLGASTQYRPGGGWAVDGDLKTDLTAGRLESLGLKVGWKDPDEWRSFVTSYKTEWESEHGEYAHQFDATFEYAINNLSGRVQAGAKLQGGNVSHQRVDALAGYRLNSDWAILGGGSYDAMQSGDPNDNQYGVRAGVQYKEIPVTVGMLRIGGETQLGIRLEIPLGW